MVMMEIVGDDAMRFGIGARNRAENLRHCPLAVPRGTGPARAFGAVRPLFLEPRPIDRAPVEPRRGSGLQALHPEPKILELEAEIFLGRLVQASTANDLLSYEYFTAKKGPGGQNNGFSLNKTSFMA